LIDFYSADFNSIDSKMVVLGMINRLECDSNVGSVEITLSSSNEFDDGIMRMMMNRYSNLYWIRVYDNNYQVDSRIHRMIKQWVM